MKKLFITATVIGSVLSSPAMAKTEGNYVGIDVINTNIEAGSLSSGSGLQNDDNTSVGVNYKYAFNFKNFFVAPGVFYNHNATKNNSFDGIDTYQEQLRYSYGIKADLGYDITNKVAAFVTIGHSEGRISANLTGDKDNYTQEAFLYGLGAKYSATDNVDINVAYEISQYGKSREVFHEGDDSFNSNYRVAKIGASYKF